MDHNKIVLTAPSQLQEDHPTSAPPSYDDVWAANDSAPIPQITASLPGPSRLHAQPATITRDKETEAIPLKTPVPFRQTRTGFIVIVVAIVVVLIAVVVGGVVGVLSQKTKKSGSGVEPGQSPGQTSSYPTSLTTEQGPPTPTLTIAPSGVAPGLTTTTTTLLLSQTEPTSGSGEMPTVTFYFSGVGPQIVPDPIPTEIVLP